jgi:hypothetical protein
MGRKRGMMFLVEVYGLLLLLLLPALMSKRVER